VDRPVAVERPAKRPKVAMAEEVKPHDNESVASVMLQRRDGFDNVSFDRRELVRLLTQALDDLGYAESATTLQRESSIPFQQPCVTQFRANIVSGEWAEAEAGLSDLGLSASGRQAAGFLVGEQQYLELLEKGDACAALQVLRCKLAPLAQAATLPGGRPPLEGCTPMHNTQQRLHILAALAICKSPEQLRAKAGWSGTVTEGEQGGDATNLGGSREELLRKLQAHIPPSVLVPEQRLLQLLAQARDQQLGCSLTHNTRDTTFSLLHDENFGRSDVPLHMVQVLHEHNDEVWFVQFSECGCFLVSASKDAAVTVWDIEGSSAKLRHTLLGHSGALTTVAWCPVRPHLLTCGKDGQVCGWDAESGTLLHTFNSHSSEIQACSWFPDGDHFVSSGLDKKLHITVLADGELLRTWELDFVLYDVAVAQGCEAIVATCSDRQIRLFNIEKPGCVCLAEKASITSIAVNKAGTVALVNLCSQEIHMWDLKAQTLMQIFRGHKQYKYVLRSIFGGEGEAFVACGSEDGKIYIWHRQRGRLLESLEGHQGMVNAVAWNPGNPYMMASAGDDHTVRIWVSEAILQDAHAAPSNGA